MSGQCDSLCLRVTLQKLNPTNPRSHSLFLIGPDADATAHGSWHVYCCLECYCYATHFQLPTSFLVVHWFCARVNMDGAWLASCNLIWTGTKTTKECNSNSFMFSSEERLDISPGIVGTPSRLLLWHTVYTLCLSSLATESLGGLGRRRAPGRA